MQVYVKRNKWEADRKNSVFFKLFQESNSYADTLFAYFRCFRCVFSEDDTVFGKKQGLFRPICVVKGSPAIKKEDLIIPQQRGDAKILLHRLFLSFGCSARNQERLPVRLRSQYKSAIDSGLTEIAEVKK